MAICVLRQGETTQFFFSEWLGVKPWLNWHDLETTVLYLLVDGRVSM